MAAKRRSSYVLGLFPPGGTIVGMSVGVSEPRFVFLPRSTGGVAASAAESTIVGRPASEPAPETLSAAADKRREIGRREREIHRAALVAVPRTRRRGARRDKRRDRLGGVTFRVAARDPLERRFEQRDGIVRVWRRPRRCFWPAGRRRRLGDRRLVLCPRHQIAARRAMSLGQ